MRAIETSVKDEIAACITWDRDNLFDVADQVISAAPLRQWPVWAVDARSAYFPLVFLERAYDLSITVPGHAKPLIVSIANSRSVQDNPVHQKAVQERLATPELRILGNNVLVVSDYSESGGSVGSLSKVIRQTGAREVDAAIINNDDSLLYAYRGMYGYPDNIYSGRRRSGQPRLYEGILRQAIGQVCVVGIAEAQDTKDVDLELRGYATQAFVQLAEEYTESRT